MSGNGVEKLVIHLDPLGSDTRACFNLLRDVPDVGTQNLYPRLRCRKVKDPKVVGGGVEREGEKGREKRQANDADTRTFFKQSELFQGQVYRKAVGESVSPLGTHEASAVSALGRCAGGWKAQPLRLYENSPTWGERGVTGR